LNRDKEKLKKWMVRSRLKGWKVTGTTRGHTRL